VYNSSHVIIIKKKKKHEKEHAFADIITSISFGPKKPMKYSFKCHWQSKLAVIMIIAMHK